MHLGTVKTKKSNSKIFLVFAVVAVVLVGLALYFSFSKATVTIYPKALAQDVSFEATVDQNPNLDPREIETISGRIITAESNGSKGISEVSEKTIEERANGTFIFYNNTSKSQALLPSTQIVNSDGVKFRTDARINVPAGGSVEVTATADIPGASGNVETGRFTIIRLFTGLQKDIYAENKAQISNGTKTVQVVTEQDIEEAKNALADELYGGITGDLKGQVEENETFLEEATRKEIIDFASSVEAGTETDNFSVDVTARVTAVVFDEESLLELAESKLRAELTDGRELSGYNAEDLSYTVTSYDINAGTAELKVGLTGTSILKLSNDIFDETKIFGLTRDEAVAYFLQYPDIDKVEVELFPSWITRIPNIESKIEIKIAEK